MALTPHQEEILEQSISILKRGRKRLLIKGSAGVGKTFFANYLIKKLVREGIVGKKVICSAPTNKALAVLRGKVHGIKVSFQTTHAALKLKRHINYKTGNVSFKPSYDTRFPPLDKVNLFIIDETSMLSKDLLSHIEEHANENNTTVIFIGDEKQLPPVNEKVSPVFVAGYPEVELTEIVRQGKGNPIIDLSRDLSLMRKKPEWLVGENGYTFTRDMDRIIDRLAAVNGTDEIKYLAYTNKDVDTMNLKVRKKIYGTPNKLELGESVVFNSPYLNSFYTNQEKKIEELEIVQTHCQYPQVGKVDLKLYVANPGSSFNPDAPEGLPSGILSIHEDSQKDFYNLTALLKEQCKTRNFEWVDYYHFIENFADLKYNHALTIHKSQGSTYEKAIVNVGNIMINRDEKERQKLLYTGFTRASDLLILKGVA